MTRFFWLKSDRKTVQEISFEKFRELAKRNLHSENYAFRLVVLHDNGDFYHQQGRRGAYIHGAQLKQVLEAFNAS